MLMGSGIRMRCVGALACAVLLATGFAVVLSADLVVQGTGSPPVTFNGHGGYSADALGQATEGGTVQAQVPAGSTVVLAYLYAATIAVPGPTLNISFDGTDVTLDQLTYNKATIGTSYRADVTDQVTAKVGVGGLPTEFTVNTVYSYLNGVALIVIYSNPAEPEVTIYLLDGGLPSTPQQEVDIFYPVPIDPTLPDFNATLSLGISFSAQEPKELPPGLHTCGHLLPPQSVRVDVNGVRLTSCAGGSDDGTGPGTTEPSIANQVLVTVGGVGDLTDNPADQQPGGEYQTPGDGGPVRVLEDELYDVTALAAMDVNKLSLDFNNPSGDDQVFLAILMVRTEGTVAGTEGPFGDPSCSDSVDNDGDGSIDSLDSDCAPPPEDCTDGIDNDGDGLTDGQDPDCAVTGEGHRITGGATVVANPATGTEVKLTVHLRCDLVSKHKDKLDVSWSTSDAKGKKKQDKFTLGQMTSVFCTDDPYVFPAKPGTKKADGFDTHDGSGTGTINGTTSATIFWQFRDGGEPGRQDFVRMVIMDSGGNFPVIFEAPVKHGNIQAHTK